MANNNNGIKISPDVNFPSQLDSFENKKKTEWGLRLAQAIQADWFYGFNMAGGIKSKYYTQRWQFIERRLYAKGLESMDKFKQQFKADGDKSFLNLSSKPISIIPKLVDVVVNGFANRGYAVKATGIDPLSTSDKLAYRKAKEDDMLAKDIIEMAKNEYGVTVGNTPLEEIPETKMELDLHMALEYKQSYEISCELAIEAVMNENRYNETVKQMGLKDQVICGVSWEKHKFVPGKGIVVEYVNPENKIQSYTEDPYFRDCFYHGEFKTVPITEVLTDFPWLNDPENLEIKEQLEKSSKSWWDYHRIVTEERIKGTTNLLYFTYKTTRTRASKIKEKSTGERVLSPANETFDEKKAKKIDFKRVEVTEEILFEGIFVLGTEIMLKWEVAENMVRPKSSQQKVMDQYIGVAPNRERGYIDSLVARMMPLEDKLNILELKAEQVIQRIMPDGYIIDPDAIAELDFGQGNVLTAQNVIDMFFQTGSIFARSFNSSGDPSYSLPIKELRMSGSLDKLNALRAEREGYTNLMRDVIGLNKASDASTPDKDSLVGIQKLASSNSNLATRHILTASSDITKRISEAIVYRLQDLMKYSDMKEDLIRKIGATSVADLESMSDFHLYDFGISIDLELDDEEKAKLEADMSLEIQKGTMTFEDKYKVLNIKNFKYAVMYASLLREKREKKMQEQKTQDIKANADAQAQASAQSEQAKQQTEQMVGQIKSQLQEMMIQGDLQKIKATGEEDRLTLQMKIEGDKEIAQMNGSVAMHKFNEGEERKDQRTKMQATQQSELIDQRLKNKDPKDFENNEDFDMSVFQANEM